MKRTTNPSDIKKMIKATADASVEAVKATSVTLSRHVVPKELVDKYIEKTKTKAGRPTKYNKTMCQRVIKIMAEGRSKENAATLLGVSVATMWHWANNHPEFLKAVNDGEELSLLWWMEMGKLNIHNKEFNSTLYMMQMQNRHGWTRKLEGRLETINKTEHTEKRVIEIKGDEKFAEIAKILFEAGAIEPGVEETSVTTPH